MSHDYGMPAARVLVAMDKMRESESGQKYMAENAPNDSGFAVWLMLVDRILSNEVQVGHRDLSDWGWRDAFENGTSPKDAAQQALGDDDLYGAIFGDGD